MTNSVDEMTERLLRDAGIGPSWHVLDVGSGLGDVAPLLARLVGDQAQVVGFDRNASSLAMARQRTRARAPECRLHTAEHLHAVTR